MNYARIGVNKQTSEKVKLNIDPRSKLIILVLINLSVIFSTSVIYDAVLIMIIAAFGIACKRYKFITKMVITYAVIVGLQIISSRYFPPAIDMFCTTFIVFIKKLFPCGMFGGVIVSTTYADEFITAMCKLHMSQKLIICLTVMLRYFPMIKEDWTAIKNAMRMRGISPSVTGFICHPGTTIECIYVPLIMSASKVADELSAAAVTRAIENPEPHTCIHEIKLRLKDYIFVGSFIIMFLLSFAVNWG